MRKIGRYTVQGILGKGGMSTVYKVAMPITGKIAALKLMTPPELLIDILSLEKLKDLFLSEAIIMANLRHPHIADVWDVDEYRSMPFFIMEYFCNNLGIMIGEEEEVERRSRLIDPNKIFRYGRQILDGLSCLHQAGIVHRDIKPYNILITDQDTVKIADFGLSKLHGEKATGPPQVKVGSPYYAAPEQRNNPERVDGRADLYSFGVMIHRMVYGALPEQGKKEPKPDMAEFVALWDDFLERAAARNTADRFQSAAEMLEAFLKLENHWQNQKVRFCQVFAPTFDEPEKPASPIKLRRTQLKVAPKSARGIFKLNGLMQPLSSLANDFSDAAEGTVLDRSTGLVWQLAGSDYPMTWHKAWEYILQLNNTNNGGRSNWRLPTVDELLSLVRQEGIMENICIDEIFDRTKKRLWSCDCRSAVAAWYVSMDMGFVAWQDHSCSYFVRPVSSLRD
jgi:serine/threonine protein kinase